MWLLLGAAIGVIATLLTKKRDSGLYAALISLGIIGGLFGGIVGSFAGLIDMADFTWLSLAPAAAGSVLSIVTYLVARRPRRY